ncbi:hypothetical protein K1T36_18205 [Pseudomonas protegens]|uniref:hypothetical protein n=1 Tax=Pseudomonas protegens TaxID=380021 RepID=UPI001C6A4F2A|nr:hypothetical protein [Pseudomonas protegens]QYM99027.1 hypothetical protein K1T36_18205 [Pseudomonas protegens]
MIIDKLFDTLYEEASRFITKWRGVSFVVAWIIVSGVFLNFFEIVFWRKSAAGAGGGFIEALFDIPLYQLGYIAFTAFYIGPLIANRTAIFIVRRELKRAEKLMSSLNAEVDSMCNADAVKVLPVARKFAIEAEEQLEFKKALNEAYTFFLLVLMFFVAMGSLNVGFLLFFGIPWFVMIYFLAQEMLALYLKKIYYFKRLSNKFASNIGAS